MVHIKVSVAEWSKALVLGTSLFGGVGSNPTAVSYCFVLTFFDQMQRSAVEKEKSLMKLQSTQILSLGLRSIEIIDLIKQ